MAVTSASGSSPAGPRTSPRGRPRSPGTSSMETWSSVGNRSVSKRYARTPRASTAAATRSEDSLSSLRVMMSTVMGSRFQQGIRQRGRDGQPGVALEHAPLAAGIHFQEHVPALGGDDDIDRAVDEIERTDEL